MAVYQGFDTDANILLRRQMKKWLQRGANNNIVLGDFNEVLSADDSWSVDAEGYTTISQKKKGKLHKFLNRWGLTDTATLLHPNTHAHTHIQQTPSGRNFARLDYIYMSHALLEATMNFTIHSDSNILSDHIPISCTLTADVEEQSNQPNQPTRVRNVSEQRWK